MSRGALDLLRRVALRVLVAVLVAVILSALGASAGRAAVPDSIVRNAPQVTNYLYRGGGTSTIPGCGGVCSDLWLAEHRPIPGQPASRALWSELTNLRTASGVLPRLGLIGTASAVVAGAGAFTVGWQIGTAIRGIFIEGEMPAAPAVPDQIDYFFAKDFARGATYGNVVITQPGYYVGGRIHNTSRDTYEYLDVAMPGPECPRASPGDVRPPFGSPMPNLATGNFVCVLQTATSPPVTRPTMMFRTNLQTKPAVDIADAPSVGRLYTANTIPDPGAANVQSRMLDELDRYPGQYPNLIPWLQNNLGEPDIEDPTNLRVTVRANTCSGLTQSACVRTLTDLGLQDVTAQTLDFAHAAPGVAPGRVTAMVIAPPPAPVLPQFDPAVVTIPEARPVLPWPSVVENPLPATLPAPDQAEVIHQRDRVKILVNPTLPQDIPVLVPDPNPNEHYSAYLQRLQDVGLVGRVEVLPDSQVDLDLGPDTVVRTSPSPRSRVRTGTETSVQVNPTTAPAPGPGPAGQCGLIPPTSAIDLTPITSTGLGSKVPFSLLPFIGTSVNGLATPGAQPQLTVRVFGASANLSFLSNFNDIIGLFRLLETILLWSAVAWFLYGRTIGKAG